MVAADSNADGVIQLSELMDYVTATVEIHPCLSTAMVSYITI
jgi:hypothetical protein